MNLVVLNKPVDGLYRELDRILLSMSIKNIAVETIFTSPAAEVTLAQPNFTMREKLTTGELYA